MPQRAITVLPSQLQLRDHDFETPDWYETIPQRTRLRLLTNLWEPYRNGQTCTMNQPPERRVRERFENIFDRMPPYLKQHSSSALLTLQEYRRLKRQCDHNPYSLPEETVPIALRFLSRLKQRAPQEELRELIDQIPVDEEFFRYFEEQIEAEQILTAEFDRSEWARAHFKDHIERFAFVLERYLDNH